MKSEGTATEKSQSSSEVRRPAYDPNNLAPALGVARAECVRHTTTTPVVEHASSERTAVMTALFPLHLFPYPVKT